MPAVAVGELPVPARGDPALVGLLSFSSLLSLRMLVVLPSTMMTVAMLLLVFILFTATRRAGPVRMPRWTASPG